MDMNFTVKKLEDGRSQIQNSLGNHVAFLQDAHEANCVARWLTDLTKLQEQQDRAHGILLSAIKEWPKDMCLTQKHAVSLAFNMMNGKQ